jgi:hypothetical protein
MRTVARVTVAALAAVGLILAAAAPATAAGVSGANWVASPIGVVGVQQSVVMKAGKANKVAGQVATVTFTPPAGAAYSGQTVVNSGGYAAIPWMPAMAGTWTVTAAVGGKALTPTTISVSAMPTAVDLLLPAQVAAATATSVRVLVKALAGPITPSGTITLEDQNGNAVGTAAVGPSATAGVAVANVGWTPSSGTTSLTASFTPASSDWSASTSGISRPSIGGAPTVTMRMPQDLYSGVPVTLTAISSSGTAAGGVAFSLNIDGFIYYPMGGSKGINTGPEGVDFAWTPSQIGYQNVQLAYNSANFSTNARASQQVNVLPSPTADSITLTSVGSGPWQPGAVGSSPAGLTLALSGASTSGNPVTLSTNGPCQFQGADLTLLSPGTCVVTAVSLGNGGSLVPSAPSYEVTVTK